MPAICLLALYHLLAPFMNGLVGSAYVWSCSSRVSLATKRTETQGGRCWSKTGRS